MSKKCLKNLKKLRKQNIKFLETIYRIAGNKISKKSLKNLKKYNIKKISKKLYLGENPFTLIFYQKNSLL